MRGNNFISLSFLDQILSAELLSKISKKLWGVKIYINPVKVVILKEAWSDFFDDITHKLSNGFLTTSLHKNCQNYVKLLET